LLVTDLVMPVMNGHELADAARSSRPALKVLYTTGYADDEISSRCVGVGSALLEKPYRIDTLATQVAAVLSDG
jgi:CheY-like chemotaxis protein